jgi:hypothetical protein
MERSHARNNHRLPLAKGQNRIGAASSDISSDVVPPIQVKVTRLIHTTLTAAGKRGSVWLYGQQRPLN